MVVGKISSILFRVAGRKSSEVLHHDRLKLCNDRNIPLWLKRKRHDILSGSHDSANDLDNENTDLEPQGSQSVTANVPQEPHFELANVDDTSNENVAYVSGSDKDNLESQKSKPNSDFCQSTTIVQTNKGAADKITAPQSGRRSSNRKSKSPVYLNDYVE